MKDINEIMPKDLTRFWSKVEKTGTCWIWKAGKYKNGYGKFGFKDSTILPHRFAYVITKGQIPEGLAIDHLCRNRLCVNPEHLEAVTIKENILRGTGIPAQQAKQTNCIRGHLLDVENCYITPDGRRQCRKCNAIRQQECVKRKSERCKN